MATKTPSVEQIIADLGGPARAAEKLGIANPSIVWNWRKRNSIPADRVVAISKLTGIPAAQLRPDIFGEAA